MDNSELNHAVELSFNTTISLLEKAHISPANNELRRALPEVLLAIETRDTLREALKNVMSDIDDDSACQCSICIAHRAIAREALAATEPKPVDFCTWTEEGDMLEGSGNWFASCGEAWTLIEGTPEENHYRHCPGCGKPIKQVPFVCKDEEDEEPKP